MDQAFASRALCGSGRAVLPDVTVSGLTKRGGLRLFYSLDPEDTAMPTRLTPQEKKRLSLQKDRRESHGQNDKASRRLVPLRKAQAQRRLRRGDKQQIDDAVLAIGAEDDTTDAVAPARAKPDFQKWPGKTLEEHIRSGQDRAERSYGRKKRTPQERADWYRKYYGDAVAERMKVLMRPQWGDVE